MDQYLSYLLEKDPSKIPHHIRGQAMYKVCYGLTYIPSPDCCGSFAGLDVHSCTATVAALILWLCGVEQTLSQVPSDARRPFAELANTKLYVSPYLIVFHLPHHKCALLCVGSRACLLHSNQDVFHGSSCTFTLAEHLLSRNAGTTKHMNRYGLGCFLSDMALLVQSPDTCQSVCQRHFGIPFRSGHPSQYWFTEMPVLPLTSLA